MKNNKIFQYKNIYSNKTFYDVCPAFCYLIINCDDMNIIKNKINLLDFEDNYIKTYIQYFTELLITYTNKEVLDLWEDLCPGEISKFLKYMKEDLLWIFQDHKIDNLLYLTNKFNFKYWEDKNSFSLINIFFNANKNVFLEVIKSNDICQFGCFEINNMDNLLDYIYKIKNIDILKIIIKQVNEYKEKNTNQYCPICLDSMDKKVILKCGHSYHAECINKWILFKFNKEQNSTCPLCDDLISDNTDRMISFIDKEYNIEKKIFNIALINNHKSFIKYYLTNFNKKIYYDLEFLYQSIYPDFSNNINKYYYNNRKTIKNISDNLLLVYKKLKNFYTINEVIEYVMNGFIKEYNTSVVSGIIRFHSTEIFRDIIKEKGNNFIDTILKKDYCLKNLLHYGQYSLLSFFDSIESGKYIKKNLLKSPILMDVLFNNSDDRIMKYVLKLYKQNGKNLGYASFSFLENDKMSSKTKLRKIKIILNFNFENIDFRGIERHLINNNSTIINKWVISKFCNNNIPDTENMLIILNNIFKLDDKELVDEVLNKLDKNFNYWNIVCLLIKNNFNYYYFDYIFYKIYFKLKKLNEIDKKNILDSIKNIYYEYPSDNFNKFLKFYDKTLKIIKLCNVDLNNYRSSAPYRLHSLLDHDYNQIFKIGILNGISFPKMYRESISKHNFYYSNYYFEYKNIKPYRCLYKLILSLQFRKKFRNKKQHKVLYNNTEVDIKSRPPTDKKPVLRKGGNLFYNDFNEIMYLTDSNTSKYINPIHIQPVELLNIIKNEIILTPKIDGVLKKNLDKELIYPYLPESFEYFNLDAEYIKELDLYLVFGIRNNAKNHECVFDDYLDLKSIHSYASKTDNDFYIKYNSKKIIKQKILNEYKEIFNFYKKNKGIGPLWWPKKFWRVFDKDIILDILGTFQEIEEEIYNECNLSNCMVSHIKKELFKTDGLIINIPNNKNIIYKLKPKREMTIDLLFDKEWKDKDGNLYSVLNNKEQQGIYRCYFRENKWVAVDYRPDKKYPNSSKIVNTIINYHQNPWNLNDIKEYNDIKYYQIKDNFKKLNIRNNNIIRNNWFAKHIKNNYKILDLGCGFFIKNIWNNKTLTIDGIDNDLQLVNYYNDINNKQNKNFYIQDIQKSWNFFDDNIKKIYNPKYTNKIYDIILFNFSIQNCFKNNGFQNIMNEINKRSNNRSKILVRMIDKNTLFWSNNKIELPDNGFIELIRESKKKISYIRYFYPWKHNKILKEPILSFIELTQYMEEFGWVLSEDFNHMKIEENKYYKELNKATKNLLFTKKINFDRKKSIISLNEK